MAFSLRDGDCYLLKAQSFLARQTVLILLSQHNGVIVLMNKGVISSREWE
jgi:hypothetical protein